MLRAFVELERLLAARAWQRALQEPVLLSAAPVLQPVPASDLAWLLLLELLVLLAAQVLQPVLQEPELRLPFQHGLRLASAHFFFRRSDR